MTNIIEDKLKQLNIKLDEVSKPAGSYVPYVVSNNLVFISGQLPFIDGAITIKGKVDKDVSINDGIKMAEVCAKALLSQLKAACNGDLDKVIRVVKLGGFVASSPDFTDHPKIINGASDRLSEVKFNGWMFASSPALSALEDSVYDISILSCTNDDKHSKETSSLNSNE
ncbi:Atu1372/SO_1960 family protein [Alphaproteobacteria bacterium]|nr:Atu1372/SO_1960 family protein [Alphaproteobacteria bacterium]